MKTTWMKSKTAGFRAMALLAVLGASAVLARQPDEVRVAGEAVALDEVVLVSKTSPPPGVADGNFDLPLLGGGGGTGGGGAPLLGGLPLLGTLPNLPLLGN
jgi:hypothetical protein